jgi:hypothetical protein
MKLEIPALLCLVLLPSCLMPQIGIEPRVGPVLVDGDVSVVAEGLPPSTNSTDDLGLDDADAAVSVRGDFKWGSPHLSITLQESNHDGNGTLSAAFGNPPIVATTPVNTDFDLGLHTGYLTFDFIPGDWELGVGLGVVVVDVDFSTTDGVIATPISADETLPVPVLAARGGVGLGPVDFEALIGISSFDAGDAELTFFDVDVNGRIRFFGDGDRLTGLITLGVRHTDLDAEYEDGVDDVELDLAFTGPYLGIRLQF